MQPSACSGPELRLILTGEHRGYLLQRLHSYMGQHRLAPSLNVTVVPVSTLFEARTSCI